MKLSYYGHASLGLEFSGFSILVDPFITGNPAASHIDIETLQADYILLTHGHVDHILDAEAIAKRTGAKIIANYEVYSWYEAKGLTGHPLNHGGKASFDFGTVKYVNAVHSSVLPDGTYGGNPGGFVIWNDDVCFYISGDTALTMDMKLIPMTCPKLDFAVMSMGDNFTMGYDDAVIASKFVECNNIVGVHYDTFPPIAMNQADARNAFESAGMTLHLPAIGETISL